MIIGILRVLRIVRIFGILRAVRIGRGDGGHKGNDRCRGNSAEGTGHRQEHKYNGGHSEYRADDDEGKASTAACMENALLDHTAAYHKEARGEKVVEIAGNDGNEHPLACEGKGLKNETDDEDPSTELGHGYGPFCETVSTVYVVTEDPAQTYGGKPCHAPQECNCKTGDDGKSSIKELGEEVFGKTALL